MNWLNTIFVLGAAFLAVFWEAAFGGVRHLLGAQVDLLPPLMVYAGLCTGMTTVTLLALCGGLWFDSLSANPLGVTVLPLFAIGLAIHLKRELDPARPDLCPVGAGPGRQRGGAGADAVAVAHDGPRAAAGLGHALATGGDERGRGHRDAHLF